jgi:hydrogenase maturation factor HypF (carbamoyltransferase family)
MKPTIKTILVCEEHGQNCKNPLHKKWYINKGYCNNCKSEKYFIKFRDDGKEKEFYCIDCKEERHFLNNKEIILVPFL